MSIMLNENSKIIVLGITGKQGSFHTKKMLEYGSKIVAGVTPGKEGLEVEGIKVFNSIENALKVVKAEWAISFVPARFAKDSCLNALKNGLNLVVITEGIPVLDSLEIVEKAKEKNLIVIGPNCPGIISPEKSKLGIMPEHVFKQGNIGLISRSGTLTYEIVDELTRNGFGQSTCIGIGGDPVTGTDFITCLKEFEKDSDTKAVIVIGEIGGAVEEKTAEWIKENFSKPVVAYIAGVNAPEGKTLGHAGAVISGNKGTAKSKITAFEKAGVKVAELPSKTVELLKGLL
ncbi:MAG: succinate--CoA ligase subunit alpha [archaeon]